MQDVYSAQIYILFYGQVEKKMLVRLNPGFPDILSEFQESFEGTTSNFCLLIKKGVILIELIVVMHPSTVHMC